MRYGWAVLLLILLSACDAPMLLPPDGILPDGSTYHGELQNGLLHGQGVLRFRDGDEYTGSFKQGLMHGPGYYRYADGSVVEGEFASGELVHGTLTSEHSVYQGGFQQWQYHGAGALRASDGSWQISGNFDKGMLSGQGEQHNEDGSHYRGEFLSWSYHGQGVLTQPDGVRIEGQFEYGEPVGDVVRITINEQGEEIREQGSWDSQEFVAAGELSPQTLREQVVEQVLREDAERLQRALLAIAPQRPGQKDIYYLVVGGDGDDSVFVRDVAVAQQALHQQLGAAGRGIVLLNDRQYSEHALATRENIRLALAHLAGVMNAQEDVLFVHLASHGRRGNGALTLRQPGIALADIDATEFADMLAQAGVPDQILVISACYAGHWLDALATERNLILASAHRGRTSFGCGDASAMTWFSRALYVESELQLADPRSLFAKVESLISRWEAEQGFAEDKQSLPQFHLGKQFAGWSDSMRSPAQTH